MVRKPDPYLNVKSSKQRRRPIPTLWLSGIFVALPILILALYFGFRNLFYHQMPVNSLDYFVLALAFFISGLTGIVYIIRREFPQVVILKGTLAVIFGMFITVLGWGIAMYSLYSAFKMMF